jgi:NitT/TauT family transport system substrate-binding protein
MTRRKFLEVGAKGAGALAAGGLVLAGQRSMVQAQRLTELKIGYLPSTSYIGIFLADDLGYFRRRGIKIKYEKVVTGAAAMGFMATGELDLAAGGIGASTFNAVARGMEIKLVANKGVYWPNMPSGSKLMVRSDLYKKGIRSVKDLKGLKLALNAYANVTHYHVSTALEQVGLSDSDVELVTVPLPQMITAMKTGAIDAVEIWEPFTIVMEQMGYAYPLIQISDVVPNNQYAHIFYGGPFIKSKPELAQAFMEEYLRGVRKYFELGAYHSTVTESLLKHTRQKREMLKKMIMVWIDINGDVDVKDIERQQEWYVKKGFVKRKIDVSKLVDKSYVKLAWQKLGKVPQNPGPDYWKKVKVQMAK